jgi:hypothetical protein
MRQDAEGSDEWDDIEDEGVLDASDTLDDDRVSDPLDVGISAADRWHGANRFGTTAAEQRAGEPLDLRLAEEEPDVDPYAGVGTYSDSGEDEDESTRRGYDREPRAGRLVAEDDRGAVDAVADDVGIDGGAASAEEAAVHVVDDPNGEGDGPLR